MARQGEYLNESPALVKARSDLLAALKNDDAVKNPPRFMAAVEALVDAKIAELDDRFQRQPFRFR